jgi:hypothetical protein
MSKKGGGKSGGSKRDGGALYKGMAIKLSDIVVGDTLGALQPYLLPAPRRWDLVSRRAWDLCTRPEYRACPGRARARWERGARVAAAQYYLCGRQPAARQLLACLVGRRSVSVGTCCSILGARASRTSVRLLLLSNRR